MSFAASLTHRLYGVPRLPGVCFLLIRAQAARAESVWPVAALAIAVTHRLNAVPFSPYTCSFDSPGQGLP